MQTKSPLREGLVLAIVVLFVGMSIIPIAGSISIEKEPSIATNCNLTDDCHPVFNGTMGHNGWYVSPVNVSFVYNPEVVAMIFYSINGGQWIQYNDPFTINEQGLINFEWHFKNYSGEWSDIFVNHLKIDYTPPLIYLHYQVTGDKIVFIALPDDNTSGVVYVEFYFNNVLQFTANAPGPYEWTLEPLPNVNGTITVIIYDEAGNNASSSWRVWTSFATGIVTNLKVSGENITCFALILFNSDDGLHMLERVTFPNSYAGFVGKHLILAEFHHIIHDVTPPSVKIVKPENGIYIFGHKLKKSFDTPLIIGRIRIEVEASDNESGMNHVEFYIDDKLQFTDYSEPYRYVWKQKSHFFPYTISAVAYDNAGNYDNNSLVVWKLF